MLASILFVSEATSMLDPQYVPSESSKDFGGCQRIN